MEQNLSDEILDMVTQNTETFKTANINQDEIKNTAQNKMEIINSNEMTTFQNRTNPMVKIIMGLNVNIVLKENDNVHNSDNKSSSSTSKKSKTLNSNFKITEPVLDEQSKEFDKALFKVFISGEVSFFFVDNPFFCDLLKMLEPGYTPSEQLTLAEHILDKEAT
ncbi:9378_t:CDS:2 [Scutellospora calospora]|uniref:9378_t:CDS:1 n=1 Tax=Scutellospora calospora TaxID=85575 RepID=A0ACA9MGM6_9GLOM|nr:9378_t:CDS:2 [Scutellospora calospora]